MAEEKEKLPPESENKIIEISLRHVVLAFGGVVIGVLTISTGIVFARDYAKYRRQKAILDSVKQVISTITNHGGDKLAWNKQNKNKGSTSIKTRSKKQKKS